MDQNNDMNNMEYTTPTQEPVEQPIEQPVAPTPTVQQNVSFETRTVNIPDEYKPITMWGYFGYELLFSIPCVGFIILCVFALGGTKNINLKNFARSYFCFVIIGLIIGIIGLIIALLTGTLASYAKYN